MKPIFTVEAGEYLVAKEFEHRGFRVWLPSKDTGIDLLISDHAVKRFVSVQAKFSGDFSISDSKKFGEELYLTGLFSTRAKNLHESPADYWILMIASFKLRKMACVVVKPRELYDRLEAIRPWGAGERHFFIWITTDKKCWETNGLRKQEFKAVARGDYSNRTRDMTCWLENWKPLLDGL